MYKEDSNNTVENIVYDDATVSATGDTIEIRDVWMPKVNPESIVYKHLADPFSFDHFTAPRPPIDLGPFDISAVQNVPRVLRMTIKPVGSMTISLPEELKPLRDYIVSLVEYDNMVNGNLRDNEVHITTDYSFQEAKTTQRFPGWHVDGLQGGKFKNKLQAEHSYVIATTQPTQFCIQPFFIKHYDEDKTNFFKAFDQQARDVNVFTGLANHAYLMDAYMVHRTPLITEDCHRGFIRITVANNPLPIEFNTLNPMLEQERAPFKLDIRDWLRAPDVEVIYPLYGLSSPDEVDHPEAPKRAVQDVGTFENAPLSETGITATVTDKRFAKVQPLSPTYSDMMEPFNARKYLNPRLPIDLGVAPVHKIVETPNVLRMLLKWDDGDTVYIPEELRPIKALLMRIFQYDKSHNPMFGEQVCHITHDTRVVEQGKTHRFPGFHGDDLQGGSFPAKETAAHSYIVTTGAPTEFCLQPFFVDHIEDTHEQVFTEFDKQAHEENIYYALPNHLYLMDPYAVHRTPLDPGEGERTFLRVTFSTRNMLLPAYATRNPMMKFCEDEYKTMKPPHEYETFWTQRSDKDVPYALYGLKR